jgi:thiol-disulfide isomerase/thioredoxin
MKYALLALIMSFSMGAMAQASAYDTSRDSQSGALVYKGTFTVEDLTNEPEFGWMATEYTPREHEMKIITPLIGKYNIVIFLGTWCEDSQNLVPQFVKIITEAGYPLNKLTLYGVDRAKTTGKGIEKRYLVTLVPTFIFYDGKKEIGRITEKPENKLESDIADILEKANKGK